MNYKNLFKSCFKHSDNLLILLTDSLVIIDINSSTENTLGWKKKEVCNQYVGDIFTKYATSPFIKNVSPQKHRLTTTEARKDNHIVRINWKIIPVHSAEKHNVILVSGHISKQAKNNHIDSAQLDNIVKYAPGLVYWKDKNSVYQGCNDEFARLAGLDSSEQVKGKTDFDLIWKDGAEFYIAGDQIVLKTGKPNLDIEEVIATSNNKKITVISNKVPLLNSKNQVVGIMGITTDITHQKEIEKNLKKSKEAAEAASRAKTEFIANMGHDIRTPLTGIIGFSHYLENKINTIEEKNCAKQIHDSGEQLLNLLNGVLDMITADSTNEHRVLQETFDLHEVIQDVLKLELPAVKAHHLTIETHIGEAVPHYVVGDKMKLHRILLNLTGNAIKFTKIGRIELNAKLLSQKGDTASVEFEVKDTGIGIPNSLQDKVFDRFFKVSPSYKGLYTGNGIGLHIAQKYVDLLGGEIKLKSQEGIGTSFFFTLKMKLGDKKAVAAAPSHGPIASQSMAQATAIKPQATTRLHRPEQLQVLLIEDNTPALNILQMMFKPFDVAVTSVQDAESAFLLVQQNPFDLIITDIGLPEQSGDELAREIRAYEKAHHRSPCIIVGLTGHSLGEITKTCLDSGMNEVYRKPIAPDALKALMDRFIPGEKEADVSVGTSASGLGVDLPKTEEELFEIDHLPLLDIDIALTFFGTLGVARTIFESFNTIGILPDLDNLKAAHAKGDWANVQALAHKMKAGSLYGTVRLQYAFLYMERYQQAGHMKNLENLYVQMLRTIDETVAYLDTWLINTPTN